MFDAAQLDIAQAVLVRLAVVALMVSLGLRVPARTILASRRERRAVVATFALALLVVPFVALVVVQLVGLPEPVAIGLLLVAAAPAGSLSLKLVDLADGDVALAIGLFFALAAIAPITMPLTAALLVGVAADSVRLDVAPLLVTLVAIQLVPLGLGMLVARAAPDRALALGTRATQLSTAFLVALIAAAIAATGGEVLAVGPAGIVAIVAIVLPTVALGLVLGRADPRTGRAVAFLAGQRSVSLALLVAIPIGEPAITGAVVAFGLGMLLINPVAARLIAAGRHVPGQRATTEAATSASG
jgi:BASS family bile acid:Na+ symporter